MSFISQIKGAILGEDGTLSWAELFSFICLTLFLFTFFITFDWDSREFSNSSIPMLTLLAGYILANNVTNLLKSNGSKK